jgi:hypothetical protein
MTPGSRHDGDVRDVADEDAEVVDEVDDVPPGEARLTEETVGEVAQRAAEEQPEGPPPRRGVPMRRLARTSDQRGSTQATRSVRIQVAAGRRSDRAAPGLRMSRSAR